MHIKTLSRRRSAHADDKNTVTYKLEFESFKKSLLIYKACNMTVYMKLTGEKGVYFWVDLTEQEYEVWEDTAFHVGTDLGLYLLLINFTVCDEQFLFF